MGESPAYVFGSRGKDGKQVGHFWENQNNRIEKYYHAYEKFGLISPNFLITITAICYGDIIAF